jgi:cytochrome P450
VSILAVDLLDDAVRADPWPVYRRLHDGPEVVRDPRLGTYQVVSHSACRVVLGDPATFSSALRQPLDQSIYGAATMIFSDGDLHRSLRRAFASLVGPTAVDALQPAVDRAVTDLVDRAGVGVEVDAIAALCRPLPVITICTLLGIEERDWPELEAASDAIVAISGGPDGARTRKALARWMQGYFRAFVTDAPSRPDRKSPGAEALRSVGLEGDALSAGAMLLLIAGHETTTGLLGNMLLLLATDDRAATAAHTGEMSDEAFVDEVLRLVGPVQALRRVTTRAAEVHGVGLPAEASVVVLPGCANRDPRAFPDPEAFRRDRPRPSGAIAFGFGAHHCLGARLAALEATALLAALRTRGLSVVLRSTNLQYVRSVFVRRLVHLPVSFIRKGDLT